MLNNVILVGRLVAEPEVRVLDSGLSVATITLAINRSFKGSDGETETDFIKCSIWEGWLQQHQLIVKKDRLLLLKVD